ncbi:hypothetical protein LTR85_010027 [Meristemomyces frigidus]|nr:hypothetical protein LTR85_010027 [Meristemomyces frigidus]
MAAILNGGCHVEQTMKRFGKCDLLIYARKLASDLKLARDKKAHVDGCGRCQQTTSHQFKFRRLSDRLQVVDDLVAAVFGTYELLEMILLLTNLHDLVRVQRVSKTFKAIIDRSARIRQALFLEPMQQRENVRSPRNAVSHLSKIQRGPWKLTYHNTHITEAKPGHEFYMKFELNESFCSRAKPLALMELPFAHGSWQDMRVCCAMVDRITITLFIKSSPRRRLIGSFQCDGATLTIGEVQEKLQVMYAKTVASESWRDYVDHKQTYKKNVQTIEP